MAIPLEHIPYRKICSRWNQTIRMLCFMKSFTCIWLTKDMALFQLKQEAKRTEAQKKLFRQKGTGNARPGNLRTPVRVGGGRAFGPKPRDWYRKNSKKRKKDWL